MNGDVPYVVGILSGVIVYLVLKIHHNLTSSEPVKTKIRASMMTEGAHDRQ